MQDASQVRVAPNGDVLRASLGSVIPSEPTEPFTDDWETLGFADESGVVYTFGKETDSLMAWQSSSPVLFYISAASASAELSLMQFSEAVTRFYYGASWSLNSGGTSATMEVSANPELDEMMFATRWIGQNGSTNLVIFERGLITERQSMSLDRSTGVLSGVTFTSVNHEGRLAVLLTDDPAVVGQLTS